MNSLHNEGMDGEFAALSKIMNFSINGGVPRALDAESFVHGYDRHHIKGLLTRKHTYLPTGIHV